MPSVIIHDSLSYMNARLLGIACVALALACRSADTGPKSPRYAAENQLSGGGVIARTQVPPEPPPPGRLRGKVVPLAYDLEIAVDPNQARYNGRVIIDIRITEPVSRLWLHGKDLEVDTALLRLADGSTFELARPERAEPGLIAFDLGRTLSPGKASLGIKYSARLGSNVGLFRQTTGGETYVFTDFEPIDARRAFPCFDEPRFKTPWQISLVVPAALEALSNMPVASSEKLPNSQKRVRFQATRPLPTYLIALAVGPFEYVDASGGGKRASPVPLRIVVPRGKKRWARDAARVAPELLHVVSEYFATPVPFPKIDMIAVPVFNGAMENPGLITVASHILLGDPEKPSIAARRLLELVCAHEFAHLWFGDLITPADWNELWLNEGFATWLADKALLRWDPARKPEVERVVAKNDAMALDGYLNARAVRQVGHHRSAVEGAFDALSYKKASAILTMFEARLSEPVFRKAIERYLASGSGGTVTTADFVRALSHAASRDMGPALSSFLDQSGVPQLEVASNCADGKTSIRIRQRRYVSLSDRSKLGHAHRDTKWRIPMCLRYGGNGASGRKCTTIAQEGGTLTLDTPVCPAWVMPNAAAAGYYRYRMPVEELAALARAPLSQPETTDLVHNLRALLYSGDMALADVLPMLAELSRSPSRQANEAIIELLTEIADHLLPPDKRPKFRSYARRLYDKRARRLGFSVKNGESEEDTLLRPELLAFVGEYGDSQWVQRQAQRLADTWLRTGRGIERGLKGVTLTLAAKRESSRFYDRVVTKLQRAARGNDYQEQILLSRVLAAFRKPELVERSLALVEKSTLGRAGHFLLRELLSSTATRERTLVFLEKHGRAFARRAHTAFLLLAPLFGPEFCSEDDLTRVAVLAGQVERASPLVTSRIERITRATRACAHFRAAHASTARAYFR